MKSAVIKKITIFILLMSCSISLLFAWGIWGHKHINHAAVFALPVEMRAFFFNHIDYLTEESVVPDIRKHTIDDRPEKARHYIDIEPYGGLDSLPLTLKDARLKYDDKRLQKDGILIWYIPDIMEKLTQAFKEKRTADIVFLAADLGHYIADANMPLHSSINHDGQLTNQRGIHALWEAQLPEMFGNSYNFNVGNAVYINDITAETWSIVKHSHQLVDTLLLADRNVKVSFEKDKIYKLDANGAIVKSVFGDMQHSYEYAKAFHTALHGMVENQIRHSITDIANFWYTAWVNAGKPDLNKIDDPELTKINAKKYKKEFKLIQKGKLFGLRNTNEF